MNQGLRFEPVELPEGTRELRTEVREFLAEESSSGTLAGQDRASMRFNREFSRKLGRRGWIGMMWPKEYGGHERSALERYVVNEELLVAGAPTTAHFVGDRQSGPLLLRFGTEEQRQKLLRPITQGELTFCIGMSEPNSGSDLASVQTSAEKVDGGWVVNGTKLWTSWAHEEHYMITLVRSTPLAEDRHLGLSQLIVDLSSPNIEIRPIYNLRGNHDFNEIVFTDCFVPDDMLAGEAGNGWAQVTSELGYERSGPERFLSTFGLYTELVRAIGPDPTPQEAAAIGRLAAHLITLRSMSISVAGMLQAGQLLNVQAAVVKDLGTHYEREIPDIARLLVPTEASVDSDNRYERALAAALLVSPQLTIQGGTREILRVVIARGIGLQ